MDAVNAVLILIYAFAFFAEEEKNESPSLVQYSNNLVIPANDFHNRSNISMESSLNCDAIHINFSSPSVNSLSAVNNEINATSSIILNQYGPYNFYQAGDTNKTSIISHERPYCTPPEHIYLEVPTLDSMSHSQVYPDFPSLTITSSLDLDRDIWKPYFNVPITLRHGASVRADIVYMFILVILAIELMAGLAVMVKHFSRVKCCVRKDMDELRNEVTITLQTMRDMKESVATKVRQNRVLINKVEDGKEGKIHAVHTAQALRNEFLNQYEALTKRLETLEENFRDSKKTMENTLKKQALDIERVVEGVNYRNKLTEMSTQTRVYPKRTGILVKEPKIGMAQKKVDFWV